MRPPYASRRWAGTAALLVAVCAAAPAPTAAQSVPGASKCRNVELAPLLPDERNPDGTQVRATPDSRGKYVPIVMVHGWTGRATHDASRRGAFSKKIDLAVNGDGRRKPDRSLIGQIQRIPGAAVFTFDYHDFSARWVDDEHQGPALGAAIDCLYEATDEKVIVVAHSMGGLVTRHALTHRGKGGQNRANEVSRVITFGTPQTGSLLAEVVAAGVEARAPSPEPMALLRFMLATCGAAAGQKLETGSLCDLLPEFARAFDSPAGRALRKGSRELRALRPVPKQVDVDALAGETTLKVPKLGWFGLPSPETQDVRVGDMIVTASSATHGATSSKTARCAYQLNAVRGAADGLGLVFRQVADQDVAQPIWSVRGGCLHGNLMRTVELTNDATGAIREDIEGRRPVTAEDLLSAPVPSLCEHPAGTLVDGELPGIPENHGFVALASAQSGTRERAVDAFGDLNGDGVGDAAAVISCNRGGVAWGESVQLYAPHGVRLGGITLTDISDEQGRDFVEEISISDGGVNVEWTANRNSDFGCCPTRDWSARLTLAGRDLRVTNVRSYDETATAQQVVDAVRRGAPDTVRSSATASALEQLSLTHEDAALGDIECHGATPIMDETWPADALDYWDEWPPSDDVTSGDLGSRYCLVDLSGVEPPGILGMEKLGYRKWRAVSFTAPGFGHD